MNLPGIRCSTVNINRESAPVIQAHRSLN